MKQMLNFNVLINLFFSILLLFFFIFFSVSIFVFFKNKIYFLDWEFFSLGSLKLNYPILIDYYSCLFLMLIFLISSMILIYSKSYMETDFNKNRFIFTLIMFIMSMLLFILSPNLISMLLGWDGLGLVSYCLVIHYQNFKSNTSGMLTALSNRIGDCFLIISICYMINFFSWNFGLLILNLDYLMIFLIIFAAITKSAQIPFSSWLPAAMAAPTPVSSLVHSSTLVASGVFLLIRFSNQIFLNKFCLNMIFMLGLLTTLMAGICANLETDMKKIVALSTLSQLGVMMSSLSLGLKELTFFHMFMHALFKALMFMCSGNFIHMNFNNQDLRSYGKMMFISPVSSILFTISNLSLCGLPFLCGFFSKDLILEVLIMKKSNLIEFFLFFIGTALTIMYTFRVFNFMMKMKMNFSKNLFLFDSNSTMNMSMMPLLMFTIFSGYTFSELFLFPINLIVLPLILKLFILMICGVGLTLSYLLLTFVTIIKKTLNFICFLEFFSSMFFLSFLSKKTFLKSYFNMSKKFLKSYSNGWIETILGMLNLNLMLMFLKNHFHSFYFKLNNLILMLFFVFIIFGLGLN